MRLVSLMFLMLCSYLLVADADADASDFGTDAAYRKKRFGTLGLGITLIHLFGTTEPVVAGGSYLSIELGKGGRTQSGALVLHAATLETPAPTGKNWTRV